MKLLHLGSSGGADGPLCFGIQAHFQGYILQYCTVDSALTVSSLIPPLSRLQNEHRLRRRDARRGFRVGDVAVAREPRRHELLLQQRHQRMRMGEASLLHDSVGDRAGARRGYQNEDIDTPSPAVAGCDLITHVRPNPCLHGWLLPHD